MAPKPKIGTRIRAALRRKGLKQGQLADALGVSRSAVNSWINDRAYPQDHLIGPLEDYLEVRLGDLDDWPPLVAGNADIDQVMTIWEIPDERMPRAQRFAMVELWLRKYRPERLRETDASALLAPG